eukprot:7096218-Pyramimonas_sp.AAC.1
MASGNATTSSRDQEPMDTLRCRRSSLLGACPHFARLEASLAPAHGLPDVRELNQVRRPSCAWDRAPLPAAPC